MMMEGLYRGSGEWAYRVGLPGERCRWRYSGGRPCVMGIAASHHRWTKKATVSRSVRNGGSATRL
ncbi:hypothetical protein ACLK19_03280 [Escherichia coli]